MKQREIKFRYRLKLLIDEYGSFKKGDVHTEFVSLDDPISGLEANGIGEIWEVLSRDEWTGMVDKNGTPLFERDVFLNRRRIFGRSQSGGTYLVKWQQAEFSQKERINWLRNKPGFVFQRIERGMQVVFSQEQIEIIGNTHENPELLNRSKLLKENV